MSAYAETSTVDGQQNGFTQFPNAILKRNHLSLGARMLYGVLLSYCYKKDYCYPSYETLMEDLDCHSQALRKYIVELITHGLIRVIRPGQGRTNIYILTQRVSTDMPTKEPAAAEEAVAQEDAGNSYSLLLTEPDLRKSQTEEYRVEEYKYISSNEEIYPSNTRKAENSGNNYVKFHGTPNEPQDSSVVTHQTRAGENNVQSRTTARKLEDIEPHKRAIRRDREKNHDLYEDITRGLLLEFITDFAKEFEDLAPLQSSTTRAYNLYRQSGLTMDAFTTYLYTARAVTKERTASIRKYTERGVKTKMAYFFAVLEDRLGLRPKPLLRLSHTP